MKTAVLLCFVFWVTATSSTVTAVRDAQPCTPILNKPGCICKSKYGLIDLTPLGFQNDSAPMFKNVLQEGEDDTISYFYNPCFTFSLPDSDCIDAFICETIKSGNSLNIGDPGNEVVFQFDNGTAYIRYYGEENTGRVWLTCTDEVGPSITLNVNEASTEFTFNLSSCYACPGGCRTATRPPPSGGHGSFWVSHLGFVGLAVMFLMLVATVSYCIVGSVLLRVNKKDEYIPHQWFWLTACGLIKDGCLFSVGPIFRPLLHRIRGGKSYQTIQGTNSLAFS